MNKQKLSIQQWKLQEGAKVRNGGEMLTFVRMDKSTAVWKTQKGEEKRGNFNGFVREGLIYVPVI